MISDKAKVQTPASTHHPLIDVSPPEWPNKPAASVAPHSTDTFEKQNEGPGFTFTSDKRTVGEKIGDVAEGLKNKVVSGAEEVARKTSEWKDQAKEKLVDSGESAKSTAQQTKQKATDAKDDVKGKAQDNGETIKQKAEEGKEKVKDTRDNIKDRAHENGQAIKEKAEDLRDGAKQTWDKNVAKGDAHAQAAKNTVRETRDAAQDSAQRNADVAKKKTESIQQEA